MTCRLRIRHNENAQKRNEWACAIHMEEKKYWCEDRHTHTFLIACLYKITELKRSHKYFNICRPRQGVIFSPPLYTSQNPWSSNHVVPHPGTRVPDLHELCNVKASRLFSQSVGKPHIGRFQGSDQRFWCSYETRSIRDVSGQKEYRYSRTYKTLAAVSHLLFIIYLSICLFYGSVSRSVYIPSNSLTE